MIRELEHLLQGRKTEKVGVVKPRKKQAPGICHCGLSILGRGL